MKIFFILFFGLHLLFFTPSGHHEPQWVKDIVDKKTSMTKIVKCKFGDEWAWKVNSCVTCNDMITYIYDWDKNEICQFGGVLKENTCSEKGYVFHDCSVIYKPKMSWF